MPGSSVESERESVCSERSFLPNKQLSCSRWAVKEEEEVDRLLPMDDKRRDVNCQNCTRNTRSISWCCAVLFYTIAWLSRTVSGVHFHPHHLWTLSSKVSLAFFHLLWRPWWTGFLWASRLKLWPEESGCTSEMEQSNPHPEGEVEGPSRPLEALLDGEEPGGPDSASSSCSDLSITTPAVQPCPNNTKSFSGLRIFGRRWVRCLRSWIDSRLKSCSKGNITFFALFPFLYSKHSWLEQYVWSLL